MQMRSAQTLGERRAGVRCRVKASYGATGTSVGVVADAEDVPSSMLCLRSFVVGVGVERGVSFAGAVPVVEGGFSDSGLVVVRDSELSLFGAIYFQAFPFWDSNFILISPRPPTYDARGMAENPAHR
jgi:hypothetical protein